MKRDAGGGFRWILGGFWVGLWWVVVGGGSDVDLVCDKNRVRRIRSGFCIVIHRSLWIRGGFGIENIGVCRSEVDSVL